MLQTSKAKPCGRRLIDDTEVSLGPLWRKQQTERKNLKEIVKNVQVKLLDLEASATEKQETISSQRNSLEHYEKLIQKVHADNDHLVHELRSVREKFDQVNSEYSHMLLSTRGCRANLEVSGLRVASLEEQYEDAKKMCKAANENEKLIRLELNGAYEKLRVKNEKHDKLEKQNVSTKQKLKTLEKESQADKKRITYLLRKIDTLFQKLSTCRKKLDVEEPIKSKKTNKYPTNDATLKKLSITNTKLTRELRQKKKVHESLQSKFNVQLSQIVDLQISLRNVRLSRDLIKKKLANQENSVF